MSLYEQELIEDFLETKLSNVINKLIQDLEYFKKIMNEYYSNCKFESFSFLRLNQSLENTTTYLKKLIEEEDIIEV